jgi:tripartite-type tricarboxylate transporter receptor subunit TctC
MDLVFWNGLWAPRGTPKEIVSKLNQAVTDALSDAKVQQRISDLGLELPSREQQTPEALGAFHRAETEKWWPIIKAAGIKVE